MDLAAVPRQIHGPIQKGAYFHRAKTKRGSKENPIKSLVYSRKARRRCSKEWDFIKIPSRFPFPQKLNENRPDINVFTFAYVYSSLRRRLISFMGCCRETQKRQKVVKS